MVGEAQVVFVRRTPIRAIDFSDPSDKAKNDREIDAIVYDLYGLTGEEIALVEGAVFVANYPSPKPLLRILGICDKVGLYVRS